MSESTVLTNKIIDVIYRSGAFSWRAESSGIFDRKMGGYRTAPKKGVSDILAILPPSGRIAAIEVKIGKDKLSQEQEGFLKNIVYHGGFAFVAKDIESFEKWWYNEVTPTFT